MTVKLVDTLQLVLLVSTSVSPALLACLRSDLTQEGLRLCTLACGKVDLIVEIATPRAVFQVYN